MPSSDPYYQSDPARWIRWILDELLGVEIIIDDRLTHEGSVDRDARVVWVPPGLSLVDYQRVVSRGALYIQYGAAVVPEFRPPPQIIPAVSGGAVIIPLPRPFDLAATAVSQRERSW